MSENNVIFLMTFSIGLSWLIVGNACKMIILVNRKLIFRENGLVGIFRRFIGGSALAFVFLFVLSVLLEKENRIEQKKLLRFIFTYGSIFIFLSIPVIKRIFGRFHTPLSLIFSTVGPIAVVNAAYRDSIAAYGSLNLQIFSNLPDDTMTLTILLLFPLIIASWQYSFSIVVLLFAVLGCLDPLLILFVNDRFSINVYRILSISLIRILVLSAIGFMITELRIQQREKQKELEEANARLEEATREKERMAAVEERNRIARDLHDTLAHTLSGLSIQLEAVDTAVPQDNEKLSTLVDKARITVRSGLGETRRALKALRSDLLDDGLPRALELLIQRFRDRLPESTEVRADISEPLPVWNHQMEENVYRIAKEALENVRRHAEASHVTLTLQGAPDFMVLSILDDGTGYNPDTDEKDGHFGLRGMRERAKAAGGELSISSEPGRGSKVEFSWHQ